MKRLSIPYKIPDPIDIPEAVPTNRERTLPTITVESPKTPQFTDLFAFQEARSPQYHVHALDNDDSSTSSDSESPDTEGVKSLFFPNRSRTSPVNAFSDLVPSNVDESDLYPEDLMSAYYADPWGLYRQDNDEDMPFQCEEPPFDPISEEAEEELADMHRGFSNTSTPPTSTDLKTSMFDVTRHLSLNCLAGPQEVLREKRSFSCPLFHASIIGDMSSPSLRKSGESPVVFEKTVFLPSETVAPLKEPAEAHQLHETTLDGLLHAEVVEPPEVLVGGDSIPEGIGLREYAIANWNQVNPVENAEEEEGQSRIIVGGSEDDDDDDDDGGEAVDGMEEEEETVGPLQMHRCQHFVNINQLIAVAGGLQPVVEESRDTVKSSGDNESFFTAPIRSWGRECKQSVIPSMNVSVRGLTSYAEDQVLVKHEEQMWANLFPPSKNVVESAKGFSAQLLEMSQFVEEEEKEQKESAVQEHLAGRGDNEDGVHVGGVVTDTSTSPEAKDAGGHVETTNDLRCLGTGHSPTQERPNVIFSNEALKGRPESTSRRQLPSLPRKSPKNREQSDVHELDAENRGAGTIAAPQDCGEHVRQPAELKGTSETTRPMEARASRLTYGQADSRDGVTDTPQGTGYRPLSRELPQQTQPLEVEHVGLVVAEQAKAESGGCIGSEAVASPLHRSKDVATPPTTTHYPPTPPVEESNFLLLPNSLAHHSSRIPRQLLHQQQQQQQEEEEPLSLFTEPVRSQSVDQLSLLRGDSPTSSEVQGTRVRPFGSCLWSVPCRCTSRQFDRAIRILSGGVDTCTSAAYFDSSDAILSIFDADASRCVVAQTRRLRLTQICGTTIEEEECSQLPDTDADQHFALTTHRVLSTLTTADHPVLVKMTSPLRARRSQSYIAPSEFDESYVRHQLSQAHLRLPDVPPHGKSTYNKQRSYTLSSVPKNVSIAQRFGDSDNYFPSKWSPSPDRSTSAGMSPKHARISSGQLSSRKLRGKEGLALSASGSALRQIGPNGSYQRVNRYSSGVLDEYGSGDSGGSTSSYRKRLIDQRKPSKTPSSGKVSGGLSLVRSAYDSTSGNRSSTLPYKRRGSWHVDRETNYPTLDWSTPRNLYGGSRWRSFSPQRLAAATSHEVGLAATPFDSRSLHSKHLRELTKSTEQLSTGFLDNYKGIETSFNTLRAKLDAATSQNPGFRRQASVDRLYGRESTAEQLRRQCEREHRRLLKSLMSDSWEKGIERQPNPPQQYFSPAAPGVLPVQEVTLLTAPRTTNPLSNPNLEKLLRNPALMQLLANPANQVHHQAPDQNSLADQVTLAAVAGAAAATAMANFTNSAEQPSHVNPPPHSSTVDDYDWNDPETLMAAYTALAEASGGEKAFLEQLSPDLAATLVHYREQLSEKLSTGGGGGGGEQVASAVKTTSTPAVTSTSNSAGVYVDGGGGGWQSSGVVLEDVSRRSDMETDGAVPGEWQKPTNEVSSRLRGTNQTTELTPTKVVRRTYDFPTKRLLLMRSSKGRLPGSGFGLKIAGGRPRPDGRLGSFVEQIHPGDTLGYLHGEISEGDEVIEWNGIPLVGKGAAEVQAIVDTPADEVELLVRSKSADTTSTRAFNQEPPHHTCSRRCACTADVHRYPSKLCPSHNPSSHLHESLHGGGSSGGGGGGGGCFHQQHTCKQAQQPPRSGTMLHTCEVHSTLPSCIHKQQQQQQQQHVCRSGDWSDPSQARLRGGFQQRGHASTSFEQAPNSPPSERNASEPSASPSDRVSVHRQQRQVVPTVNVAEYDGDHREPTDTVGHQTVNDDANLANDEARPVFGEIELILTFDDYDQSLTVHVARARGLRPMDLNGLADPFVKLRLHPDPTEDIDLNRQIKYIPNTLEPEWQQTVVFMNCLKRTLKKRVLEVTVWDFDRLKMNDFMGQAIIHLGSKETLDGQPHWYKLHALRDIVIPGYRQPGTRSVAPPPTQSEQVKAIKLVKEVKAPQNKNVQKGRSH
uniref:Clathrin_bdg domain-containing protein n=1 Tax=Mesocestoides corti TaxID=53468 RepID=A0A5K3FTL5_MESCO